MTITLDKSDCFYRDLLTQIEDGYFVPGQRLPTEKELEKKYQIGRSAIRNGLERLEQLGYLQRRQGSGTYIALDSVRAIAQQEEASKTICIRTSFSPLEFAPTWWNAGMMDGLSIGSKFLGANLVFDSLVSHQSRSVVPLFPSNSLYGVIAIGLDNDSPQGLLGDIPDPTPKILLNRPADDARIPWIDINHFEGARQAARLLLQLGHRRIAILSDGPTSPVMQQRVAGYRQAFDDAGIGLDENLVLLSGNSNRRVFDLHEFHQFYREAKPTALMISQVDHMIRVMDMLHYENVRVPADISLVLMNDAPEVLEIQPRLTRIHQPLEQMARTGIQWLADLHDGKLPAGTHKTLSPEIILGDSLSAPKKM